MASSCSPGFTTEKRWPRHRREGRSGRTSRSARSCMSLLGCPRCPMGRPMMRGLQVRIMCRSSNGLSAADKVCLRHPPGAVDMAAVRLGRRAPRGRNCSGETHPGLSREISCWATQPTMLRGARSRRDEMPRLCPTSRRISAKPSNIVCVLQLVRRSRIDCSGFSWKQVPTTCDEDRKTQYQVGRVGLSIRMSPAWALHTLTSPQP